MYRILHKALPFQDKFDIICNKPPINGILSAGMSLGTSSHTQPVFVLTRGLSSSRMPQFSTELSKQDPRGAAHSGGTQEPLLAEKARLMTFQLPSTPN